MPSDIPNDILPNYEVLDFIGRGGMGVVYKARQRSLNRVVAVKLLAAHSPAREGGLDFAARFKVEAQAMARLAHPHIVAVHDFGEAGDGQLFYVMELVEGADLAKRIESEGKLAPDEAARTALAVCDALAFAHEQGVVHRDIKPSNILIDAHGQVKVADFGLAKVDAPLESGALTRTGLAVGTPEFVAPETLIMGTHVDGRADLYAVGVMLYQMLTGEIPRGVVTMPGAQSQGVIDRRFDHVITKAMQSRRESRYQSAAEMRKDLEAILNTPLTRDAGGASKRGVLVGIAAVLVGLGGGAFWFAMSGGFSAAGGRDGNVPSSWKDGLAEWWSHPRQGTSAGILAKEANGSRVVERKGVYLRDGWGDSVFSDVALRVTVRDVKDYTSLYLRSSGSALDGQRMSNYTAVLWRDGTAKIAINDEKGSRELARFPAPPRFDPAASHTLEFHARGDELTIVIDGAPLKPVRDRAFTSGKCFLTADPGVLVERLEYRELKR